MKTRILMMVLTSLAFTSITLAQNANYVKTTRMLDEQQKNQNVSYQFYDGMGRPYQTATNGLGSSGTYLYIHKGYDGYERISKEWFPVIGNSESSLMDEDAVRSLSNSQYNDEYTYKETAYDALDRVVSINKGGKDWIGKSVNQEYVTNDMDKLKVKHYLAPMDNSYSLKQDECYTAGTLSGVKTTDEDGHTLIVFSDLLGQKILERRDGNNDTYYVYNDLGQLRYVLSPDYQNHGYKAILAYEYRYDERGRVIKKMLPGCEYIQYWYDKDDRLTFMQDANLRSHGKYRFMLYDNLNRLCVQGLCGSCNRSFTNGCECPTLTCCKGSAGFLGTDYVLSQPGLIDNATLEAVSYYDNYDFLSGNGSGSFPSLSASSGANATGLKTGAIVQTSNGSYIYSAIYYDSKGLPIETRRAWNNYIEISKNGYTFTDQPSISYYELQKDNETMIKTTLANSYNTYNDKVETANLSVVSNTGIAKTKNIAVYQYDDLGRVENIKRSDTAGDITYAYNLRGWTTDITGKGFCEKLYYTDGPGTPCYNGNISSQQWKADNETDMRGYKFSYDGLNRLTTAVYGERGDMSSNVGRYDEKITGYTANSAITGLQRNGKQNNLTYGLVDDLDITLNGNQLSRIADKAVPMLYAGASDFKDNTLSVTGAEYQYNGNGSLVSDANKGITKIEYDNMNNPRRIQFTNGNVTEYIYSVSGEKLRTIHRTAVANITVPIGSTLPLTKANTLSVDSTDYIDNIIFHNGRPDKFLFNGGYCSSTANYQPVYHYYTQDHLGNNRAVVNENGTLEQVTHYYPFGDVYGDTGLNASAQQYKYNGKELDRMHGLDWYDYGARNYDAAVPQFTTIDRYCEKYYNISPYAYCGDNPSNYIDYRGDSIIYTYKDQNGQYTNYIYRKGSNGNYAFYDKNGNIYNHGELFVNQIYDALKKIESQPDGSDLAQLLISDKDHYYKISNNIGENRTSGTNVSWNPNLTKGGTDLNGKTDRPAFVGLTHELAHAYDNAHGITSGNWLTLPDGTNVSNSDKYATCWENLVRSEQGIPLRRQYVVNLDGNNSYESDIIDPITHQNLFYNVGRGCHNTGYKLSIIPK